MASLLPILTNCWMNISLHVHLDLPPRIYYLFLAPERPLMATVPSQLLAQYYGTLCQLR